MNIVFQSSRLYFREFTTEDVPLLFELNGNPNVIRYVHEPSPTIENATNALHHIILPQYKLYNHGRWAVHLRSTGEFIGWCGFKYIKENDEIDLGYRFKEEYWGKGFGFEAASATLDYGFKILHLKHIIAKALPENIASWKIMEKCHMQYTGKVADDDGLMVKKYELHNTQL